MGKGQRSNMDAFSIYNFFFTAAVTSYLSFTYYHEIPIDGAKIKNKEKTHNRSIFHALNLFFFTSAVIRPKRCLIFFSVHT